jgi:hypothetical protein
LSVESAIAPILHSFAGNQASKVGKYVETMKSGLEIPNDSKIFQEPWLCIHPIKSAIGITQY